MDLPETIKGPLEGLRFVTQVLNFSYERRLISILSTP